MSIFFKFQEKLVKFVGKIKLWGIFLIMTFLLDPHPPPWVVIIMMLFEIILWSWPPPTFNLDVIKFTVFFFEVVPNWDV